MSNHDVSFHIDNRFCDIYIFISLRFQVKLELIRQAETLEQVKEILGESVGEAGAQPAEVSWTLEKDVKKTKDQHQTYRLDQEGPHAGQTPQENSALFPLFSITTLERVCFR